MDIIKREDRYEKVFMKAYKSLSEKDQGAIFEFRVKSDEAFVTPEYFNAALKLSRKVFDEDEDLGLLVLRKLLPEDVLISNDLSMALEDYFNKTK